MAVTPDIDISPELEPAVDEPTAPRRTAPRWLRALRGPVGLLVLAVLLVAAGVFGLVRANAVRTSPSASNTALVDTASTTEVAGDISDAVNRIFSYSYDNTTATAQAATEVLTGNASSQYATLFAQVRGQAQAQHLVLTTRVVAAGVTRLTGDAADLVVFIDQTARRGDNQQTSVSAAQLAITALRQGSTWLISDIQAR